MTVGRLHSLFSFFFCSHIERLMVILHRHFNNTHGLIEKIFRTLETFTSLAEGHHNFIIYDIYLLAASRQLLALTACPAAFTIYRHFGSGRSKWCFWRTVATAAIQMIEAVLVLHNSHTISNQHPISCWITQDSNKCRKKKQKCLNAIGLCVHNLLFISFGCCCCGWWAINFCAIPTPHYYMMFLLQDS